jgi:hypothetical protein
MYRPGGYSQVIGADFAKDRGGRRIASEADSFTCAHCSQVVFVNARERAADIGGFCKCCTGLLCGPCVDIGTCTPLEKRLQAMERRQDTLRSYGMG